MPLHIGLLGGSFDPFHVGHLRVAETALAEMGLNRLIVVPANVSPHKQDRPPSSSEDRWLMAVLGTLEDPRMEVVRWELERTGVSYTYDTVAWAKEHLGPEVELHWIIGADNVAKLMDWHRAEELLGICRFLVIPRGRLVGEALEAAITEHIPERWRDRVKPLPMHPVGISSTEIRDRAAEGDSLKGLVPPLTGVYLERYNLYRSPAQRPPVD